MRILVACEFSGIVRDAFLAKGHEALSCDLLPTERPGPHYQGDVKDIISDRWDMMIAFPPCTHLCISGARWFSEKRDLQVDALQFVSYLLSSSIPKIAIENPIGIISTQIKRPDQIIQPYMFGHTETKATCLWLKNLPPLMSTCINLERNHSIHFMAPSPDRAKNRSRTFENIALAMAEQWSF